MLVKKDDIESGYVASFDKDGALAWDTVFDLDSYLLNLSDMAVGEDGVVAISGSRSEGTGGFDAAVFLFSGDGAYLWGSYFEQAGTQGPGDISVDFAPNGDIVVAGLSTVEGKTKPFALRVDREGELVWWKQALREPEQTKGFERYQVHDMVVGEDGRIALLGEYRVNRGVREFYFYATSYSPFVLQLDGNGEELFYKEFGYANFAYAMTATTNDTYMICGATRSGDLALWEMDMEGNVLSP
jgi:hypothetical protein